MPSLTLFHALLCLPASLQEETEEERGRRIASQWTTDPDAAAAAAAVSAPGCGQTPGDILVLVHCTGI